MLGITQIKSIGELKERASLVLDSIKKTRQRMSLVTEQMNNLHKKCEDDLHLKLQRANEANQQILNKLITVFGKLDAVLR